MSTQRRNWSLRPFTLWRANWGERLGGRVSQNSPLDKAREDGATITDKDTGLIYEATISRASGQAHLTSLTILVQPGQRITPDLLRRVPVQRIAEQVSLHLAEQESAAVPVFTSSTHRAAQDMPSVEDVAQGWHEGLNREALATRHRVSVYTIDKRLREARDTSLIPPARTGRKRSNREEGTK